MNGKYSITKEGHIILIPLTKTIKLEYYEAHFGLFNTYQEACAARATREIVNAKYLRVPKE